MGRLPTSKTAKPRPFKERLEHEDAAAGTTLPPELTTEEKFTKFDAAARQLLLNFDDQHEVENVVLESLRILKERKFGPKRFTKPERKVPLYCLTAPEGWKIPLDDHMDDPMHEVVEFPLSGIRSNRRAPEVRRELQREFDRYMRDNHVDSLSSLEQELLDALMGKVMPPPPPPAPEPEPTIEQRVSFVKHRASLFLQSLHEEGKAILKDLVNQAKEKIRARRSPD